MNIPVERLSRDIANAAKSLSSMQARYLVDAYYIQQEDRKRTRNQERMLAESKEPNLILSWLAAQNETLEDQIKRALDKYTDAHPMGEWMRTVKGIGPVIAAGLLAHIDITKAPTVGHIWRFAGLDPSQRWSARTEADAWVKVNGLDIVRASTEFNVSLETLTRMATTDKDGKPIKLTAKSLSAAIARRPWNATLKTLCWKIGQSFMKLSNDPGCYYGIVYRQRKQYEIDRNERGDNRELAASLLPKFSTATDAHGHLSKGVLPPAQIDARARRYAVKRFLADVHTAWYWIEYKTLAPKPYVISHLNHAHWELAPVFGSLDGLSEALLKAGARE
jgi:hypothetical protein